MIGRAAASGGSVFGLYLALAGTLSPSEIGAGLGTAILAVLVTGAVHRASLRRFDFALTDLAANAGGLAALPGATWRTGRALLSGIRSGTLSVTIREETFADGGERDPRARARRASALFRRSLAPDGFVLRLDQGRDRIVVHALRPESGER